MQPDDDQEANLSHSLCLAVTQPCSIDNAWSVVDSDHLHDISVQSRANHGSPRVAPSVSWIQVLGGDTLDPAAAAAAAAATPCSGSGNHDGGRQETPQYYMVQSLAYSVAITTGIDYPHSAWLRLAWRL